MASNVARFSVSLEKDLLDALDAFVARHEYPTRSEAIKRLIHGALIADDWQDDDKIVAGAVIIVYDHHTHDLVHRLMHIQHDHSDAIISSQHVHLDHDHCLEMITVKGEARKIHRLTGAIRSVKGIKHCSLVTTSAGEMLP